MSWRPKNWLKLYRKFYRTGESSTRETYEAGADAVLEALKVDGKHTDGKAPTLSINVRPEQQGWLVFIPDKGE